MRPIFSPRARISEVSPSAVGFAVRAVETGSSLTFLFLGSRGATDSAIGFEVAFSVALVTGASELDASTFLSADFDTASGLGIGLSGFSNAADVLSLSFFDVSRATSRFAEVSSSA